VEPCWQRWGPAGQRIHSRQRVKKTEPGFELKKNIPAGGRKRKTAAQTKASKAWPRPERVRWRQKKREVFDMLKIGFGCCAFYRFPYVSIDDHDHRDHAPVWLELKKLVVPKPKVPWVQRLYFQFGLRFNFRPPEIQPHDDYEATHQYFRHPRTGNQIKADTYVVKLPDLDLVTIPETSTYQRQRELIEKYQEYKTGIVSYLSSKDALGSSKDERIQIPPRWFLAVNRWPKKNFQPEVYQCTPQQIVYKRVPSIQDYLNQRSFGPSGAPGGSGPSLG
jgi:hypothetical protein